MLKWNKTELNFTPVKSLTAGNQWGSFSSTTSAFNKSFNEMYVSCTSKWAFCFQKDAVEALHRKPWIDRLVFTLLKTSRDSRVLSVVFSILCIYPKNSAIVNWGVMLMLLIILFVNVHTWFICNRQKKGWQRVTSYTDWSWQQWRSAW